MLAAQNNQFNTVRLLLARGETIEEPHANSCKCEQCAGAPDYDELRHAQTRLTTFRALCSEAYIVHTSSDPILTAFERSKLMLKLAIEEKKFKVIIATRPCACTRWLKRTFHPWTIVATTS